MLALVELTRPGPFLPRTIELGRYLGAFVDAQLVAMAGERMRLTGFTEVSAVCTHPDYLGRGYARRLIAELTNAILDGGELPFLHFAHENVRAKALYERLGFEFRADVQLHVVTRQ
jgi:predicted GNAT family acetyltransferase